MKNKKKTQDELEIYEKGVMLVQGIRNMDRKDTEETDGSLLCAPNSAPHITIPFFCVLFLLL